MLNQGFSTCPSQEVFLLTDLAPAVNFLPHSQLTVKYLCQFDKDINKTL